MFTEKEVLLYGFIFYIVVVIGMIIYKGFKKEEYGHWTYCDGADFEDFFFITFWPLFFIFDVSIKLPYRLFISLGRKLYEIKQGPDDIVE